MPQPRVAKRHKWRLACEITGEGRSQRALVLDLSKTGLFVQTSARLRPASEIEVRLQVPGLEEPVALRAVVARTRQVPSQLTTVAQGGVGLRIRQAPPAYYDAIRSLEDAGSLRGGVQGETRLPPPRPATQRYRVRVQQHDGPRSRSLELRAESPEAACSLALAQVGAGWDAVRAEPLG